MGARAALVKGGHLEGAESIDVLYSAGAWREFASPRVTTRHTHGTGCTCSAAIAAGLALGLPLERAVERAKLYVARAIAASPGLGAGCGPVNHFAEVDRG
jgi:hydroxymethylpyrimidine/phosphomethylpyrimidine kinase